MKSSFGWMELIRYGSRQSFRSIIDEKKHDIVLGLIGLSVILFLLTVYVAIPAFAYFPADSFYYIRSLPIFYWIGISITVSPLIMPFNNKSRIIFVIMLGLYLNALPVILYNNPRVTDVYAHEASAMQLLNHQGFSREKSTVNVNYAGQYPGAFLFEAIQSLVTDMPHFILLKFTSIFLVILPGVLVYLIAKDTYPNLASIASLAFLAVFSNGQSHFSPQLFALNFYLILLFCIQKVSFYNKGVEKAWIIIAMLAIVMVNISNPTQSYFLFGTLLAGLILMRLLRKPFRWNNKIIEDRLWTLLIFTAVVFTSWSAYVALDLAIHHPADILENSVRSLLNRHPLPITPNPPAESVKIATYISYFAHIGTVIMGIMTFVILYKRKFLINRSTIPFLIVIAALFVFCICFFPFALLYNANIWLLRGIMYASIAWSISVPFFMSLPSLGTVGRRLPVVFGIVLIILLPITNYGVDYFSFVPSSELYMADFIDQHSGKAYVLFPITPNTFELFFYYHTLNHNSSSIGLNQPPLDFSVGYYRVALESGEKPLNYVLSNLTDWANSHPNQVVVSFGYQDSLYSLHEGDKKFLPGLEAYMNLHHNLVSYSGQARTYIARP